LQEIRLILASSESRINTALKSSALELWKGIVYACQFVGLIHIYFSRRLEGGFSFLPFSQKDLGYLERFFQFPII
jgi:hypothetical protein